MEYCVCWGFISHTTLITEGFSNNWNKWKYCMRCDSAVTHIRWAWRRWKRSSQSWCWGRHSQSPRWSDCWRWSRAQWRTYLWWRGPSWGRCSCIFFLQWMTIIQCTQKLRNVCPTSKVTRNLTSTSLKLLENRTKNKEDHLLTPPGCPASQSYAPGKASPRCQWRTRCRPTNGRWGQRCTWAAWGRQHRTLSTGPAYGRLVPAVVVGPSSVDQSEWWSRVKDKQRNIHNIASHLKVCVKSSCWLCKC